MLRYVERYKVQKKYHDIFIVYSINFDNRPANAFTSI